ncbi:hypothetical protein, partial [Pseudomonas aeruginosa]|uniref:hypothetical protein n=1 Tax=Pseudomonas aeruginosa TaxID=287 RepID=UPI001ED9A5C7
DGLTTTPPPRHSSQLAGNRRINRNGRNFRQNPLPGFRSGQGGKIGTRSKDKSGKDGSDQKQKIPASKGMRRHWVCKWQDGKR